MSEDAIQELRESFASAMREMRTQAGLSQREAAKLIPTTQANLSYLENGKGDVRLATAQRIANAYGFHFELVFEPMEETSDEVDDIINEFLGLDAVSNG